MKRSGLSLSMLLWSLFSWSSLTWASELKVGDNAPDFSLSDQHGDRIALQQFKGQWVVLYFYPKDDTPGCTTEACSFRDNINRLIAQKAVVLGVSVDSAASHKKFADHFKLPFSLLADEEATVARSYGALLDFKVIHFAKRHSFIIDPQGKLAKIYRDVDPKAHVRDVMADLKQLQTTATQ